MHRIKAALKHESKHEVIDENEAQKRVDRKDVRENALPANRLVLAERKSNTANASNAQLKPPKEKTREQKRTLASLCFGGGSTLMTVDCAEDIDRYTRYLEKLNKIPADFLSLKVGGVDGRMRQILVDWLIHVQYRFQMNTETLSLAVHMLDRSLMTLEGINKQNLQLLGVTCLFIASKFEEIVVPNLEDFVYVAANIFTKGAILRMEQRILHALNFNLSQPHSILFLRRYRFYLNPEKRVWAFAKFCSEVALVSYSLAHLTPSVVAAASIFLATYTFGSMLNAPFLFAQVFRMDEAEVVRTARAFVDHVIQFLDPSEKLYALRNKYKDEVMQFIADEQLERLREFGDNLV